MRAPGLPGLLASCLGACVPATALAAESEDTVVRRLTPPPLVSIQVTQASRRADFGQNTDCSDFALGPRELRFFLRRARAVSKRYHDHEADWTECRADGTVRYANGMQADWTVEIGGRGVLTPRNGRRKGVSYYLQCDACSGFGKPP